jgi:hypothetical protein
VITLLAATLLAIGTLDGPLTVDATISSEPLEVDATFTIDVSMTPGEGWSASDAGLPGYIVQLGVPASVVPDGKILTEHRDLARNEYLQAPYERLVKGNSTSIAMKLLAEPGQGHTIAINVLGYMTAEDGQAVFALRRVELPVRAGASGTATTQATTSDWGTDTAGLQIGDHAPDLTLPHADGSTVSTADLHANGPLFMLTYRAFW